jgi:hypothetical protein
MINHSSISCGALAVVAGAMWVAEPAQAQHAGDVFVEVFGGRIVTGLISGDTITHDLRTFPSEFGEIFPNYTDEPGFDSEPGTFPVGSEVGFDVMESLRVWNGNDFSTPATPTLTISFASLHVETSNGYVPGFSIPVASNGEWHKHLEFELNAPATDGVYLLALQLWSTDVAIDPSRTFYVVFNQNEDDAVHDEAVDYVKVSLIPGIQFADCVLVTGGENTWNVFGATPGNKVYFGYSFTLGVASMPGCPGTRLSIKNAKVLGSANANANGEASFSRFVPNNAAGLTIAFQAAEPSTCAISNWLSHTY